MKAGIAELLGTFTLTFIGAAAGAQWGAKDWGVLGVALAHGIALVVIIYAWGPHSGAHVNPAVTLGLLVGGKIDVAKAVVYWIAQFAGAIAAAFLLRYLIGVKGDLGATIGSLTATDSLRTIIVEAVLTFFLVSAVYSSGVYGLSGNLAGVAIGLVLTADILAGGALTGASMNPARSFGPFLALGNLAPFWMYLVGPAVGGVLAALVYQGVFADEKK